MANKVIHKRSTVKGQLPTGSTLEHGEIAVNFNSQDPFLSIKDSDGTYRKIIDETAINDKLSKKSDSTHTHSQYVNQNAFSNVKVGDKTIEADTATDTLTLVAGSNITITPDTTSDKITIATTGLSKSGHNHDDRYYTESEVDAKIKTVSDGLSNRYGFGNVKVGETTIAADANVDTLTIAAGTGVSITPDDENDTVTIGVTPNTYAPYSHSHGKVTLTGDVSGEGTFGNGGASITTTVADNSHEHISTNISDRITEASGIKDEAKGLVDGNAVYDYASPIGHKHTLTLTGDVSGEGSVGGSISVTVTNDSHTHGTSTITGTITAESGITSGATGLVQGKALASIKDNASLGKTAHGWGNHASAGYYKAQDASTSQKGIVKLSDSVTGTSTTLAATENAVRTAYELADSKWKAQDATTEQKGIVQLVTGDMNGKTHADGQAPSLNHTHSQYVNQNAFSKVAVSGSTTVVSADTATDTLTLVAGDNVTITPDATNDKITIATTGLSKSGHEHTIAAKAYDDDVVVLTATGGTLEVSYTAKHAKQGPTNGFASAAEDSTGTISGSGASGKIVVPDITVNEYGHVTAASDKTINITLPTIPSSLKNPYSLTIQKNGTTITTYDGSTGKTANITVPTKLGELENNLKPLTFGSKTYNGSSEQTITAADLGLGSALKYCGITTTALTDGATTKTITIKNGNSTVSHTAEAGCVVFNNAGTEEFVFNGTNWELLGRDANYKVVQTAVSDPTASTATTTTFISNISQDANGVISATKKNIDFSNYQPKGNYKTIQTAVSDPTASTNTATTFIDTISQNTNGVITATKKTLPSASTSAKGIVQLSDSVTGTGSTKAATEKAVKSAYDLANGKWTAVIAKYNTLGIIKPSKSYTVAATLNTAAASSSTVPTINAITTTTNRYYAVEVDKDGVPFVNVPWSDTDTNTDTKVTSVDNHYIPTSSTTATNTAGGSTLSFGGAVLTGIQMDAKGHVTGGITSKLPANPNSHYTTHIYLGASAATTDATTDVTNPYIRLFDNTTAREDIQVVGQNNLTVKGKNGIITIDGSHNHDGTYLKSYTETYQGTLTGITVTGASGLTGSGTISKTTGKTGGTITLGHATKSVSITTPTGTTNLSHEGTFVIPTIGYDSYGHVSGITNTTYKLPSDNNTWRPVYNGVDSTSTESGATANAVKTAYDLANSKWTYNADTIKGVKVNNAAAADKVSSAITLTYGSTTGKTGSTTYSGNSKPTVYIPTSTSHITNDSGYITSATTVSKANQLATARTLWGQSFNGSANVSGAISSTGDITPSATATSTLGSASLKYKEVHVSNSVNVGSGAINYNATTGCMEIIC